MTAELHLRTLLAAVPRALAAPTELVVEAHRIYTQPIMGRRRPRKPWRIGVDGPALSAILQIEGIDAAWMPLAGGTGFDALEMIADSINAHAGIEVDTVDLGASLGDDCLRRRFETTDAVEVWREALAHS